MNKISSLFQEEYKNISLDIEFDRVLSKYKKRKRKKIITLAGTTACLIIATSIFVQLTPNVINQFAVNTGEYLSNLFSGNNTVEVSKQSSTNTVSESTSAKSSATHTPSSEKKTAAKNHTDITEPTADSKSNLAPIELPINSTNATTPAKAPQNSENQTEKKFESTATDANDKTNSIKNKIKEKRDEHKKEFFSNESKAVYENGLYKYTLLDDGTAEIFEYLGAEATVDIPDKLDGHKVVSIGHSAFYGCADLTNVTIPNCVENIGKASFHSCINLKIIIIPESVTDIGTSAFSSCSNLTDAVIGDGVKKIGSTTFQYCNSLSRVTIGKSVESIGYRAFHRCYNLKSVEIPDSVTDIGENAFGYRGGSAWKVDSFTIYGNTNTEAERYAKDNGFIFKSIKK